MPDSRPTAEDAPSGPPDRPAPSASDPASPTPDAPLPKVCPSCGTRYPSSLNFCPRDGFTLQAQYGSVDLVGQVLGGRYRILSKVGEGGMGQVFLAEHVRIRRSYALKIMRPALVREPEAVGRFGREATTAGRIDHVNVAGVYDFGTTDDGLIYIVMEYVEGAGLSRLMAEQGALPPARAAAIASQVADALTAAHGLGIVHRDLKPDNILLARDRAGNDLVKVVDFGIAKAVQEPGQNFTRTGYVLGTLEYMSPEQLIGEALDGRSDIYSLGCVLFEMLTGERAHGGPSGAAAVARRLTEPPPHARDRNPGVPEALDAVVDRALARDVAERYQTAAELRQALQAAVPGLAAPPGTTIEWAAVPPPMTVVPPPAAVAQPVTPAEAAPPPVASPLAATPSGEEVAAPVGTTPSAEMPQIAPAPPPLPAETLEAVPLAGAEAVTPPAAAAPEETPAAAPSDASTVPPTRLERRARPRISAGRAIAGLGGLLVIALVAFVVSRRSQRAGAHTPPAAAAVASAPATSPQGSEPASLLPSPDAGAAAAPSSGLTSSQPGALANGQAGASPNPPVGTPAKAAAAPPAAEKPEALAPAASPARLALRGDIPAGAAIAVDGEPTRGRELALAAGEHVVTVDVPGYRTATWSGRVRAGEARAWTVELQPIPVPPVDQPAPRPVPAVPEPRADAPAQATNSPPATTPPATTSPSTTPAADAGPPAATPPRTPARESPEAARAAVSAAAQAAAQALADAMNARDVAALRRAWPGLSGDAERAWRVFLTEPDNSDIHAAVKSVEAPRLDDAAATVDFVLALSYRNRNAGHQAQTPAFSASFERGAGVWRLMQVRSNPR